LESGAMKFIARRAKKFVGGGGLCSFLPAILLFAAAAARAQDDSPFFVAPSHPLPAGSQAGLWLYCVNSSSNAVSRTFEARLDGTRTTAAGPVPIVLVLNTNRSGTTAVVGPGGFVRVEYQWWVPADLSGNFTLTVSNFNPVGLGVAEAAAAPPAAGPAAPAAGSVATNSVPWPHTGIISSSTCPPTSPFISSWAPIPPPSSNSA
jgi:hypothetical protein